MDAVLEGREAIDGSASSPAHLHHSDENVCLKELPVLLAWTFFGPLLVGYIPFVLPSSIPEILHVSSVLGSGLLVGTVLETIIPEAYMLLHIDHQPADHHFATRHTKAKRGSSQNISEEGRLGSETSSTEGIKKGTHAGSRGSEHVYEAAHYAGLATALGFLFMFISDRIMELVPSVPSLSSSSSLSSPSSISKSNEAHLSHGHSHAFPYDSNHHSSKRGLNQRQERMCAIELGNLKAEAASSSQNPLDLDNEEIKAKSGSLTYSNSYGDTKFQKLSSRDGSSKRGSEDVETSQSTSKTAHVSFGLILHGAMDGIPLGAAACSGNENVETVLLLAILLHKAPASFGLTSFLLGSGSPRRMVFRSLGCFCLSAPCTALCMALILSVWGSNEYSVSTSFTGLGLLFSAGTMIYTIATHILPDLVRPARGIDASVHVLEMFSFVLGIIIPFAIEILHGGHGHDHH